MRVNGERGHEIIYRTIPPGKQILIKIVNLFIIRQLKKKKEKKTMGALKSSSKT